jgi:hypothetical protein
MSSALPWWFFAVLFSLGFAAFMLLNQQLRLRADQLTIWRGVFISIAMAPVMLTIHMPEVPLFYLAVLGAGVAAGLTDMRVLAVTSQIGSGPVSRLMPMGVWISFTIWTLLDSSFRAGLIEQPLRALGVLGCLALCVAAAAMLRKDTVSRAALPLVIPILIGGALIDTFNKLAMSQAIPGHVLDAALTYIWVQNLTIAAMMGGRIVIDRRWNWRDRLFDRRLLIGGALFSAIMVMLTVVRNFAMAGTPNPGYAGAIGLSATLWVILFNRWRQVPDNSNIKAGLAFVLSAAILVLLTR